MKPEVKKLQQALMDNGFQSLTAIWEATDIEPRICGQDFLRYAEFRRNGLSVEEAIAALSEQVGGWAHPAMS